MSLISNTYLIYLGHKLNLIYSYYDFHEIPIMQFGRYVVVLPVFVSGVLHGRFPFAFLCVFRLFVFKR